jgi:molybdopterin-guanine dinucleotide biosynthesis protein A
MMDVVITAGGVPRPDEPLYAYTLGKPKALLEVAGKPMVQWVLDALEVAKQTENIVLIGLTGDSGLTCEKPLVFIPNQASMIENIMVGVKKVIEINPTARRVLLVSSDIPAITANMVDWEVETTQQVVVDLCYNVVKREVIEASYPGSKRTFTRLKGMQVCGADMNVISTSVISKDPAIWERLVASRKNPLKQAAIIGFDTLILAMLGIITLDEALKKATSRLHMTGQVIICPFAEVAMDVDKPNQLELIRADLEKRGAH